MKNAIGEVFKVSGQWCKMILNVSSENAWCIRVFVKLCWFFYL